jgi:hypothetical protein
MLDPSEAGHRGCAGACTAGREASRAGHTATPAAHTRARFPDPPLQAAMRLAFLDVQRADATLQKDGKAGPVSPASGSMIKAQWDVPPLSPASISSWSSGRGAAGAPPQKPRAPRVVPSGQGGHPG